MKSGDGKGRTLQTVKSSNVILRLNTLVGSVRDVGGHCD